MLAPNGDMMKIHSRLRKLAMGTFRCGQFLAEDAASDAICSAIAAGNTSYAYCRASMKNYLLVYWRDRATRNENYSLPINEEGEAMEPMASATRPMQHLRIEAMECAHALGSLPDSVRETMRLVANEFTADEIVELLHLPKSEVAWRIKYGRKLMRERDGYEIERKRGHHQFIGIRKRHRVWEATFRHGNASHYLGHFSTATGAAKAYDAKAREVLGEEAKQNFGEASGLTPDRTALNEQSEVR